MPILNTRVDADLAARFHQMCAERETTASEVLRRAVTAFVERDMAVQREHEGNITFTQASGNIKVEPGTVARSYAYWSGVNKPEPFRGTTALGEPLPTRKPMQKKGKP